MTLIRTARCRCLPRQIGGLLLALLFAPAVAGASPRDELLRFVPDDVTFGLVVQDIRAHTTPLQAMLGDEPVPPAAFWQALVALPPEILAEVKRQEKLLSDLDLGITPRQFLTDIVGDAVVFAYRKGKPEKPEQEQGMLLTWAREPKLMGIVMDRVNAYQKRSGELEEVRELSFKEEKYYRRVRKGDGKDDEFYFLRGNVFCFCTSEALIQEALRSAAAAVKVPPLSLRLERLGVDRAFFTWWLNPRSFDAELAAHEAKAQGAEQVFLRHFLSYWKATDGIAFFMSGDDAQAEMGLALRVRKEQLPTAAQRFLAEASRPSPLWQVIPEDALFAVAGRFEAPAFLEVAEGFLNEQTRQVMRAAMSAGLTALSLARSDLPTLATGLGPDWAFWVFGPAAEALPKTWSPQLLLAVRVREGADGKRAQGALLDLLQGAAAVVCAASKGQIIPEKDRDGEVDIRYLVGEKFPPGLRPAYAAKGGYFLVAGDPETIRRFKPPSGEAKPSEETPLLRISVKGWLNYLQQNRAALASYFASLQETAPQAIDLALEKVIADLTNTKVDRLEVVIRSQAADQAALTIRLKGSGPPKK